MTNWLIINKGVIVDIMKLDGSIPEDYDKNEFDTVQDDPSEQFKIGDVFDMDLWVTRNPYQQQYDTNTLNEIEKIDIFN